MKRVITGIVLGIAVGVVGIMVFELTDQRIFGWLATGILLGIASAFPHSAAREWFRWGVLGGGVILVSFLVGFVVQYPILVAWPLLGAAFGCLGARGGLGWKIGGGVIGLLAGLVGMGILPLITLVLLPALGLPTSFDYDMDVLGLVAAGAFIGGTTAWLKGDEGKAAKKIKRGVTSREKKR